MKKRTLFAIVTAATLGYITKALYKRYVAPIFSAAKQWDIEHELVNTTNADTCVVVSTLRNHYLKTADGGTFLFLSNTRIGPKYPTWMTITKDEIYNLKDSPIDLSSQAMFTAKFAVVERKLSAKQRREFKALGIALFERPISLSHEQANLVKEKMINILRTANPKK